MPCQKYQRLPILVRCRNHIVYGCFIFNFWAFEKSIWINKGLWQVSRKFSTSWVSIVQRLKLSWNRHKVDWRNGLGDKRRTKEAKQNNRLCFCWYCTEDGPTFSLCRFAELSLIPSSVLYGRYLLLCLALVLLPTHFEIRSPFWVTVRSLESEKTPYCFCFRLDVTSLEQLSLAEFCGE